MIIFFYSNVIQLEQLSKNHKSIIRKYHFIDRIVKINNNYLYTINNYIFKKLDISYTSIKDISLDYLKKFNMLSIS